MVVVVGGGGVLEKWWDSFKTGDHRQNFHSKTPMAEFFFWESVKKVAFGTMETTLLLLIKYPLRDSLFITCTICVCYLYNKYTWRSDEFSYFTIVIFAPGLIFWQPCLLYHFGCRIWMKNYRKRRVIQGG